MKRLWTLFADMFAIALCVVGGGYAILAAADGVFARRRGWLAEGELAAQLPLFQMIPGIIAGHVAVYVGRKTAGIPGAAVALAGVFLPSVIVFSAVSAGYALIPLGNPALAGAFLGLRAALTGIIAAMLAKVWKSSVRNRLDFAVAAAAAAAMLAGRVSAVATIAAALAFGCVRAAAGALAARRRSGTLACSLWMLPLVFVKYGLVAIGGGYALVPVYLDDFVGAGAPYLQLAAAEFADVMALTQMTPGPIAVNCATFFGYRLGFAAGGPAAGIALAVVATLSLLLPGALLLAAALTSIERFRNSPVVGALLAAMRPLAPAMMFAACWAFAGSSVWTAGAEEFAVDFAGLVLAVFAFAALVRRRLGVMSVIFACAALGALPQLSSMLF